MANYTTRAKNLSKNVVRDIVIEIISSRLENIKLGMPNIILAQQIDCITLIKTYLITIVIEF